MPSDNAEWQSMNTITLRIYFQIGGPRVYRQNIHVSYQPYQLKASGREWKPDCEDLRLLNNYKKPTLKGSFKPK